jgi:serine protease Do
MTCIRNLKLLRPCVFGLAALLATRCGPPAHGANSLADVIATVQPKMVKIYGAGGVRGLEPYQSGFFIRGDGYILTAWSYVLDTPELGVTLHSGRRYEARLVGSDPRFEIAVLKIEAQELDYFDLKEATQLATGAPVLAFSNLYGIATGDEPCSVLHGIVSVATNLSARRGIYETPYTGPVYVLDAMTNNAGAAGGALTDHEGRLAAMLGKELRNVSNNVWLNYAIPIGALESAVDDIIAGRTRPHDESTDRPVAREPVTLHDLGIILLPDILNKTPPFVQSILPGSPAAKAGLQADDLILYVGTTVVQSRKEVVSELSFIDRLDPVQLTVQRGNQLVEVQMIVGPAPAR